MRRKVLNLVMQGTSTIPATDAEKLRPAEEGGVMQPWESMVRNVMRKSIKMSKIRGYKGVCSGAGTPLRG